MVTEEQRLRGTPKGLLHTAHHVWRTEQPNTTMTECETASAEAVRLLAEAQTCDMPRWQQQQLALAQQLLGRCVDDEDSARADYERLIEWLGNEIENSALRVELPAKKMQLANFKRWHLSQLASRPRKWSGRFAFGSPC